MNIRNNAHIFFAYLCRETNETVNMKDEYIGERFEVHIAVPEKMIINADQDSKKSET